VASPTISFCVPTYGRAHFVAETIESALAQTVTDIEVIVVDDVSPDRTADVVGAFTDPRVRYVRNTQNLGVPANLNRAFGLARGEFVVLLEDHDLIHPQYAEKTLQLFRRYPDVGFVAAGLDTIDEQGRPLARYVSPLPERMAGRDLLRLLLTRTTCPFSVTVAVRRSVLADIPVPFDPAYWWYADQNLWMTLAGKTNFGYVGEPLLMMRTREAGHTLTGKEWEGLLSVHKVHEDHWPRLHPARTLAALRDAFIYECAKLRRVAEYRVIKALRHLPWGEADRRHAAAYLATPARAPIAMLGIVPAALWRLAHRVVRR
jgi:glycosyltransferase involved in cell wall biosynthesis